MASLIDLPADDACLLYLLRHGATPPNLIDPPIMQGKGMDPPLAEIGREQAARAATELASRPLAAVYASPLRRAMETAATIASPHGLEVQPLADLVEVEVGRWEGKPWRQVEEEDPEAYAAFLRDPGVHGYPGGETLADVQERVSRSLAVVMRDHVGQEVAVVAHSVVNRVYLGGLLGLSLAEGRSVTQANCAINIVRYRDGKPKAITTNAIGHLL